jgi:hypothetical protein
VVFAKSGTYLFEVVLLDANDEITEISSIAS